MSKENKTVELKDEELDQVAGGFSHYFCFDDGDCFENKSIKYKVIGNYKDVSQNEEIKVFFKALFVTTELSISASELASYTYLGKNVF